MENTVIQYTFLKFDQSQKNRFSTKRYRTPDKTEKHQIYSSERKPTVVSLNFSSQTFALDERKVNVLNQNRGDHRAPEWTPEKSTILPE